MVLGRVALEITLLRERANSLRDKFSQFSNELRLNEKAFEPRQFVISIERGDFVTDRSITENWSTHAREHYGESWERTKSRYCLRLCFDQPPYPPLYALKVDSHHADEYMSVYKHAVAERIIKPNKTRAMNDPDPDAPNPVTSRCIVS